MIIEASTYYRRQHELHPCFKYTKRNELME